MKVICLARQFASARAFINFKKCNPDIEVAFLSWPEASVNKEYFDESLVIKSISDLEMHLTPKCILFSGTSLKSDEDGLVFEFARKKNIPSLAYVDQWSNLDLRFSTNQCRHPDFVICPDFVIAEKLVSLGFEKARVYFFGFIQLWLKLLQQRPNYTPTTKSILFATEPSSFKNGQTEFKEKFGLDDEDSLHLLLKTLKKNATNLDNIQLDILLHPTDKKERIQKILAQYKLTNPLNLLEQLIENKYYSWVTGLTTMYLAEASLGTSQVISLQPKELKNNTGIFLSFKGIQIVRDEEELIHILNQDIHKIPQKLNDNFKELTKKNIYEFNTFLKKLGLSE